MDVVKGIVVVAGVLFAVALCLWLVVDGLRTGVVKGKRAVARAREPIFYWVMMALYGAPPACVFGLIVWGVSRGH